MKQLLVSIATLALFTSCAKDQFGRHVYIGPSVTVGGTYQGIGATITIIGNPNAVPIPQPQPSPTPSPSTVNQGP